MRYLLLLFCIASYSQQVILTAGENEYSIGQVFYQYDNGGIQVPEELPPTLHLTNFVYQTKHNLIINVGDCEYINYKLFDLTGKLIKKSIIRNKESICMDGLPKGVYLLNLQNQTFKIMNL